MLTDEQRAAIEKELFGHEIPKGRSFNAYRPWWKRHVTLLYYGSLFAAMGVGYLIGLIIGDTNSWWTMLPVAIVFAGWCVRIVLNIREGNRRGREAVERYKREHQHD